MHAPRSLGRLKKTRPTASACRLIALDVVLNRIHIDEGKEITVNDLNPAFELPLEGFPRNLLEHDDDFLESGVGPITKSSIRRQPVPVEILPQYTGSGIVTKLKAIGLSFPPSMVTFPEIVPPDVYFFLRPGGTDTENREHGK